MTNKIETIEKLLKEKTQTTWIGHANIPFYAWLEKPAPSLSKHDSECPTYWRIEDVNFVLWCANGGVQMLLDEIDKLKFRVREYKGE